MGHISAPVNPSHSSRSRKPQNPKFSFTSAPALPRGYRPSVGGAHGRNRVSLPEASTSSLQRGAPLSRNIEDTHQQLKATDPSSNNRIRTEDPLPDADNQVEATSSVHLFGQAHDISISGGEFFAAARIDIDASHNKGACTQSTSVSNLWQLNHTCNLLENAGEHADRHPEGSESAGYPSLNGQGEGGTGGEGNEMASLLQVENEYSNPTIDSPGGLFDCELENNHEQDFRNVVISSTVTDKVVYNILSNYPRRPIGNLRSFKRILQALSFSFSPLSPTMLAALFDLNNAQHVEQILLPARPLVFVPKSEDAVRFICSSMVEFFLDRTRGGEYFVDAPSAHRTLLDGCTSVMEKVYMGGQKFDELERGRRDAYEYACQNWERHRRAGARSKL